MVTVGTAITAFLYWRCCYFLSCDCLICEVNIQVNADARRKLLIWELGGGEAELHVLPLNHSVLLSCSIILLA